MARFTAAQLAALQKAIATGARSVSYDGKTVTYRDLDEMLALETRMINDLAGTGNTGASTASFSKGLS